MLKPIPGWNFTPADFAKLQKAGGALTIAPDSNFIPAKLQDNLLKTLAYVLGPQISPPATEGVNALDFFHGHLVVKKDPATAKQVDKLKARGGKFEAELGEQKAKAFGGKLVPTTKSPTGRYAMLPEKYPLTPENLGTYRKIVQQALPPFAALLDEASKLPGAAVMYHTFEFRRPVINAKGERLGHNDPRRNYVTPLDTNQPMPYNTPPDALNYEKEYTAIVRFSFLVDDKAAVHIRPFETTGGFTTLELSTITGATFPQEPFEMDK
jgi:hypothetical protein